RVETSPAASNACTPSTWLAPQESPVNANEVVVTVPLLTPSANSAYPVTPTLSVDAVQDSVAPSAVTADDTRPVGADGAVVSGQAAVVTVSVGRVEVLPAASNACTPSTWLAPQERPVNANDVVVVVPALTPSANNVYPVTATLSVDAVHDRVAPVAVTADDARPVGADGAVVSGQAAVVTVSVGRVEMFPAASNAWTPSTWLA